MFLHGILTGEERMIRAQIYLKGGDKNSGTFQYMQNTHKLDHNVEHHLDNDEIKKLNHNIFDCVVIQVIL